MKASTMICVALWVMFCVLSAWIGGILIVEKLENMPNHQLLKTMFPILEAKK